MGAFAHFSLQLMVFCAFLSQPFSIAFKTDKTALNNLNLEFRLIYTGKLSLLIYIILFNFFNKRLVRFSEIYGLIKYNVNTNKYYIIYKNNYYNKLNNKNTR